MVWDLDPSASRYGVGGRRAPRARKRARPLRVVTAVLLVVVLVLAATFYLRRVTTATLVHEAVTKSLASKNASMVLSESVSSPGLTMELHGHAFCALSSHWCTMELTYRGAPDQLTSETLDVVHGETYAAFNSALDDHFAKPWVSLPTVATSSILAQFGFSAGPLANLEFVDEPGVSFTTDGTSSTTSSIRRYEAAVPASTSLSTRASAGLPNWLNADFAYCSVGAVVETLFVNATGLVDRVVTTAVVYEDDQPIDIHADESLGYYAVAKTSFAPPRTNQVMPLARVSSDV